ncbi:hypothetical protein VTN00DRAFT_9099 [Thermoascus crustaceus]|uniref:uncharacterized protein n=1 Tax=Thermoascus crustaceus TaxID=5088 RepID=UPI003742B59B
MVAIVDRLGKKLKEIEEVLEILCHSSRSTLTRMNRLRGTDVEKGANVYVPKVSEDTQKMQASIGDALQSTVEIGRDLAFMADLALDEWVSLKMLGQLAAALSVGDRGK